MKENLKFTMMHPDEETEYKIGMLRLKTVHNEYFGIKGNHQIILKIIWPKKSTETQLLPGVSGISREQSSKALFDATKNVMTIFREMKDDVFTTKMDHYPSFIELSTMVISDDDQAKIDAIKSALRRLFFEINRFSLVPIITRFYVKAVFDHGEGKLMYAVWLLQVNFSLIGNFASTIFRPF